MPDPALGPDVVKGRIATMLRKRQNEQEPVELRCPECGARVETTAAQAETGTVQCPNGHEFAVVGILGEPPVPGSQDE